MVLVLLVRYFLVMDRHQMVSQSIASAVLFIAGIAVNCDRDRTID